VEVRGEAGEMSDGVAVGAEGMKERRGEVDGRRAERAGMRGRRGRGKVGEKGEVGLIVF